MMRKSRLLTLSVVLLFILTFSANGYDMGKGGTFQAVSVGDTYTMGIKADNTLWAWGDNENGQLGDGTKTGRSMPVKVMDNVISVSAGYTYTLAIKTDGTLWAWGSNEYNQLGNNGNKNATGRNGIPIQTIPVKVMDDVAAVSAGKDQTAAIKTDGSLWMWGREIHLDNGQLIEYCRTPADTLVSDVSAVSMGTGGTMIVKTDGELWAWGNNSSGILLNDDIISTPIFGRVKIMDNVSAISMYYTLGSYALAIKTDGSLWAWGENYNGQLGNGTTENQHTPIKVMDDVVSVSTYNKHTIVVKSDGSLWSWGFQGFSGQILGNGGGGNARQGGRGENSPPIQTIPVKIMDDVASVSTADSHTMAVKTDGSLWGWGSNTYGQLGNDGNGNVDILPGYNGGTGILVQTVPTKIMDGMKTPIRSTPCVSTVAPSANTVTLDGNTITLNAYLFSEGGGGTNYVMLRDIAYLLNGTKAQFEVSWDTNKGISVTSGKPYTPVGGEMKSKGLDSKPYIENQSVITINGKAVALKAYTIEGNNYFKLRDLGELLGFNVDWISGIGVIIESDKPYSE